jgi:hypothetical protein
MPTFFVHLEFGEFYPREWKDTPHRIEGHSSIMKLNDKGSVQQNMHYSKDEAAFSVQLKNLVNDMFMATIRHQKHFTDVYVTTYPDRHSIGTRDLLCYVRQSRMNSMLTRDSLNRWAPSNASGVTQPIEGGVVSEVWFDECGQDIGAVANVIYHELMHNKTNYATNEDAEWVHKTGGGGLAASESFNAVAQFTVLNQLAMANRLMIQNQQYVRRVPNRPDTALRKDRYP